MKHTSRVLLGVTFLCGVLEALLLGWFFGLRDNSGLLPASHISRILMLILAAAYLVFLFCWIRKLPKSSCHENRLSPSAVSAGIMALSGLTLAFFAFSSAAAQWSGRTIVLLAVCLGAAICLFLLGAGRLSGKAPGFAPSLILSLCSIFFAFYFSRNWTQDSQIIWNLFPVLAAMCAMLSTYHQAAMTVGKSSIRSLQFWSQLGLFLCLPALNSTYWMFYLSAGLLMTANCLYTQEGRVL